MIAWIGFAVLLILHLDFWRPRRAELYWGWLPEELAYRVVWMLGAWLYIIFICTRVWRSSKSEGPGGGGPGHDSKSEG